MRLQLRLFEFFSNSAFECIAYGRHRDAANDLREEATNDKSACLLASDTARQQVEQLLVIKSSNGQHQQFRQFRSPSWAQRLREHPR